MNGFLAALALSFAVIFVAELGDKSQLMALTFATRFKPVPVLVNFATAPISPACSTFTGSCSLPRITSSCPMRSSWFLSALKQD